MFTLTDGFFTEGKMKGCRGDDIYEVAGVHKTFRVEEAGQLVLFRDFLGDGIIGVIESH